MTIDSLREFGANIDEGLERCMGMEDFYIEMIELGINDRLFDDLGPLLKEGNLDDAFEKVHALKGVIGNLALTPLYSTISELTEHLRARDQIDYTPIYEKLMSQREAVRNLA